MADVFYHGVVKVVMQTKTVSHDGQTYDRVHVTVTTKDYRGDTRKEVITFFTRKPHAANKKIKNLVRDN